MVPPSAPGAVVLVRFPFSDLSSAKLRPAVVLANAGRDDWVLCQVTSNSYADPRAVEIGKADFSVGSLHITSYARPGKLFTANHALIVAEVALLTQPAFRRIIDGVVALLMASTA